jgi:PAS domain S-box-containing protein
MTVEKMRQDRADGAEIGETPAINAHEPETLESLSARLVKAEEESARFFDQSLDLLCIAGFDGYFKRLNPSWTMKLGWGLEELKVKPFIDFVHPDDSEVTLAEVDKLAKGATTILFENRYRHQDGSYRWLQWNARSIPGAQQIYATARDITERKRLEREVLEIIDQEKDRLGRELHDGLCQSLAGIAALSSTLSKRLAADANIAGSAMAVEITKLLNESIAQARDLARGLGPVGLLALGLDGALEVLALNVQRLYPFTCTLECDHPFPRLQHDVEGHLFRIAQEAVNNAVTHGAGERIDIALSCKDGQGFLSVRDNGVGLASEPLEPSGIGLHTMLYRAHLIGGALDVRGRGPSGTAVSCVFPLAEAAGTPENQHHAGRDT